MGMIMAVSLRLVYLIFDRLLDWLMLMGRSPHRCVDIAWSPPPRSCEPDLGLRAHPGRTSQARAPRRCIEDPQAASHDHRDQLRPAGQDRRRIQAGPEGSPSAPRH